jgi:hypothetical protein
MPYGLKPLFLSGICLGLLAIPAQSQSDDKNPKEEDLLKGFGATLEFNGIAQKQKGPTATLTFQGIDKKAPEVEGDLVFKGLGEDLPAVEGAIAFKGLSNAPKITGSLKFTGLNETPPTISERLRFVGLGDETVNVDKPATIYGNWRAEWTGDEYSTPGLMTIAEQEDGEISIYGTRRRADDIDPISSERTIPAEGGGLRIGWNYGHLGYWGGWSNLQQTSADTLTGKWGYQCEDVENLSECYSTGTSTWTRILPKFSDAVVLDGIPEGIFGALLHTPLPGAPKVSVGAPIKIPFQRPDQTSDPSRTIGTIALTLYGEDIFGPQGIAVTGPSGLTFHKYSYICTYNSGVDTHQMHWSQRVCESQGGIIGLYVELNVWADIKDEEYTLNIQGQEIPLSLEVE